MQYWVIASRRSKTAKYWAGYFFSESVDAAIRLSREADAQKVIDEMFSRGKAYYPLQIELDEANDAQRSTD